LSQFWTAIFLIIFYLASRNREYHLKTFDRFRAKFPILVFLSQIDRLRNKTLWQLSLHCRHPWRIKKIDFTSYNSYTVEDKQTKLGVWTDVGW
jgi:hypothetical protein